MQYSEIVARRRALMINGYKTLADVGFDWDFVTPYQKASCSADGPVLVAFNWLDAPSVEKYRPILDANGFLPGMPFNRVMDVALGMCGMTRSQIYLTQVFHLLPPERSSPIASRDIDVSFDAVTRHELVGRNVIALGGGAAGACRRHGIPYVGTAHLSARGVTELQKATDLARLLKASGVTRTHIQNEFASTYKAPTEGVFPTASVKRMARGSQERVLESLKKGALRLQNACVELELSEKQVRSAIDGLRAKGWAIVRSGPCEWRLA